MSTKDKTIQIRISDTLLDRYEETLSQKGLTKTIHITSMIHDFVEVNQKAITDPVDWTDTSIEAAKKFVERYPAIGKSLFWFGYFAKKSETIYRGRTPEEEKNDRLCYKINDMRLFNIKEMMFIQSLALERLGGELDEESEKVLELAYRDYSEVVELKSSDIIFYWMAGYTFIPYPH